MSEEEQIFGHGPMDPTNLSDRELLVAIYNQQAADGKLIFNLHKRVRNLEYWRTVLVSTASGMAIKMSPLWQAVLNAFIKP